MDILLKYFPDLSEQQKKQFALLGDIYRFWNERINVISRKDMDNLYLHHVLHSMALAKFIRLKPGLEVIDVGTGGGFPGVPLALMFPDTGFTLVDSINKKILVVNEVVKSLGIANVTARSIRAEEIKQQYDVMTGRAVNAIHEMLPLALKLLKRSPKSELFYWTGHIPEQEKNLKDLSALVISDVFEEDYFRGKVIYCVNPHA